MTSECLSWFCCYKNEEATVDLYNVSTISQVNLVSHVPDTSHLAHLTEHVYDHNISLFRTVSNDSVPDFEILERNRKNFRIINTQPEHFNPYTPAPKQSVRVTSSYPLCLSDSKTLFKKTVLDATVSVPRSFRSNNDEPHHTERRSSISKINNGIKLHPTRRRPDADSIAVVPTHVVPNELMERDGYSFEDESSFEDEYESVCCGLWPMKYKHSELDDFHYYEPVLPRQLTVPQCDAYTQTEVRGRLRPSLEQNRDSTYEVVNPRPNGATTFNTIVDIHPCIHQTNENELIISDIEHETDNQNKFDGYERPTSGPKSSVYDDAFSSAISKPTPSLNTDKDSCKSELSNGQNNPTPATRKGKSNDEKADTDNTKVQNQCLSNGDLYSQVHKPDPIDFAGCSKTDENSSQRYETIDSANTEDDHHYTDEPIYDDISNVIGDSLGFIPHEEEIDVETINKHNVAGSSGCNNDINVADVVNIEDYHSRSSSANALDKCEIDEPYEPLYYIVDNNANISANEEKPKIADHNTDNVTDNTYESTSKLDDSLEENLYDVVGNFANVSYKRYSATDFIIASQMLETYDTEPEVIYENLSDMADAKTGRLESSSESSDDGCGITFSADIDDYEGSNLDDESLYDVVDDTKRVGSAVLIKVSDVLKVIVKMLMIV